MNDFTKEELEEIAEMMRYARKQCVATKHELSYQVEVKALSMIENYCEHQWENHCCGVIDAAFLCSKCGVRINE